MDEPVTVTVAYQVTPGREEVFSDWATSMLQEAAHYVEYLGGGILGAGRTGDDWHVVFRWSSQEAAKRWEASPGRTRLEAKASTFAQAERTKRTTGVRAWFDLPARMATPPPKWKAALVTLAAVFPPVLVFNLTVIPYLGGLSVVLRTLTLCVAVTGVVTWVMMPRLQRLLKNWLNPPPPEAGAEAQADRTGVGAPMAAATAAVGRKLAGRRSRRGWGGDDDGDGGGTDDFTYGGGSATYRGGATYGSGGATYSGGGATYGGGTTYGGGSGRSGARDVGYGDSAEPSWLVEVAPRGREEDPGWRDDGWRDVKPGKGPWYGSQRTEPQPEPEYREPRPESREPREETRGWYREPQESGSWYREAPEAQRTRGEPQPDERFWEQREPGRSWYRERDETEIIRRDEPVDDRHDERADRRRDDDGPYYDTRNPPWYARQQQGRPDEEEDFYEPEWQTDRGPGTGRYRQ